MMITHKLEMDLLERGDLQRIDVVQGDRNTRQLELTLFSGGNPWNISEDARVNLRYCKADGTGGWYSQWPEGTDCWSVGENVLTILLAPPVMTAEGMVFLQIELEQGEDLLATFALQMYVERNVASRVLETDNYVDRPQWLTKQLKQWLRDVDENGTFAFAKYEDTPLRLYHLPLDESQERYVQDADGKVSVKDTLGKFSPPVKCPRYLGWKLDGESQVYLYIGDLVDGEFRMDETYIFHVHTSKNNDRLVNFLQKEQNRFIEVEEGKYFRYRISKNEGVAIVGCDSFPEGVSEAIGFVPDSVSPSGAHMKGSMNYGIVLPAGCSYAVVAKGSEKYSPEAFNVSVIVEKGTERISDGVSVGRTAKEGVTLLTVPDGCKAEDLTVYLSKQTKTVPVTGKGIKAKALAEKLIRDFSFDSQKSILWNDSALPLQEGKHFCGVPYSSRWVNSHYVGFEVSVETALNALNDPYSIAYDGGKESIVENPDGSKTVSWFVPVSGASEIPRNDNKPAEFGGPGYGLVCSAFMTLIFGNPYPQSNRGFTFDSNFSFLPMAAPVSGTVAVNRGLSHCVMVDELYEDGYSILEATDPCVAKTVHTSSRTVDGALNGKTSVSFLDDYCYTVTNLNNSGYDNSLLEFPASLPNGIVRPWRGHKSVYGPWDKLGAVGDYAGSGIGVTLHPTNEQTTAGTLNVKVDFIPKGGTEADKAEVLNTSVSATEKYLNIAESVTASGTYYVSGGDGTEEMFRYYDHAPVTLTIGTDGRAVFSHDDVLYAYVRVSGYGKGWEHLKGDANGPVVIAAGGYYPDLVNMDRITEVYAAIVADPEENSWGKYSCLCSIGGSINE